jgi:peroxisomal coenzyme A diphosphatase NUDT7
MYPGRADSVTETAFETARREAYEEIGLPNSDDSFLPPFRIEHLCELPAYITHREVVVRPCIALLHSYDTATSKNADPAAALIAQPDAKEVSAVFTAPFHNFLLMRDEHQEADSQEFPGKPEDWYSGEWLRAYQSRWRSEFYRGRKYQSAALTYVWLNSASVQRCYH